MTVENGIYRLFRHQTARYIVSLILHLEDPPVGGRYEVGVRDCKAKAGEQWTIKRFRGLGVASKAFEKEKKRAMIRTRGA